MDTKLLIDAIVHQTTVLIAQLSTAAGFRAPLAHIADQVFAALSKEIESQGVSRKVAADMFGLAIRTYQKKVQRVLESASVRDRTLWEAVLEFLHEHESVSRRKIYEHFRRDDPTVIGSVLNDLVSSSLVYKTGSGDGSVFGVTKDRDIAQALNEQRHEALQPIVWLYVYRSGGISLGSLRKQLQVDTSDLLSALVVLENEKQISRHGDGELAIYRANHLLVPVGAEAGWEAAVFDHFQAVARAIITKVRLGKTKSQQDDVVGGATLTFDIGPEHPLGSEVLSLLHNTRTDVNALWNRVQAYNLEHPIADEARTEVSFYFGQSVTPSYGDSDEITRAH